MASFGKEITEIIDKNYRELLERVQVSEMFKAELIQRNVFQAVWLQDLKGKIRSEQISDMLAIIRVGTVQQYDGFREALTATNQSGVVTVLPNLETDNPEVKPSIPNPTPSSPRLWEPAHPGGGDVVMLSPQYSGVINKKRPDVCKVLRVDQLWDRLRQHEVLSKGIIEEIQTEKSGQKQASALLDHLEQSPVWKLHAFLRTCVIEEQGYIVDILGLDKQLYKD